MTRFSLIILLFFAVATDVSAQKVTETRKYSSMLGKQLTCNSNPKAGKLLMELSRKRFISKTYVVQDSISYYRLKRPMSVLGFNPVAVFGFQQGYDNFFLRSPGTAPPEMVGIITRDSVSSAKTRLSKLGLKNVRVEEHLYNLAGNVNRSKKKFVEIMCWERH